MTPRIENLVKDKIIIALMIKEPFWKLITLNGKNYFKTFSGVYEDKTK